MSPHRYPLVTGTLVVAFLLTGVLTQAPPLGHPWIAQAQQATTSTPTGARPQVRSEIPSLRTRTSRTYALSNGQEQVEISPGPVNYQAGGGWQPIDNTLDAETGGVVNRANAYHVHFPHDLAQAPIRVETTAGWVEFRPEQATGAPALAGETATYSIPGVRWQYTAGNNQVKENIILADASSPSSFTYALHTGPGISARQDASGGIALVDAAGARVGTFAAPYMVDSSDTPAGVSHALRLTLSQSGAKQTMTLAADPHWLQDPARRYPVTIDPSLTLGIATEQGAQDCKLVGGGYADTNFCRQSNLTVGYDGIYPNRVPLQFNIAALQSAGYMPANAVVQSADLGLYLSGSSTGTATTVSAYALTQAWTQGATWNTYDGTNAWGTPGGQFTSQPVATSTVSTTPGWVHWYPSAQLVQGWVDGSVANTGLILKEPNESVVNLLQFYSAEYATSSYWPSLKITYVTPAGDRGSSTFIDQGIHDGLSVAVNVASGNLLAQATDFSMAGIGLGVGVDRSYNSLLPPVCVYDLGYGWHTGDGETTLYAYPDGSQTLQGPSGEEVPFTRNPDGSFTSPPGMDADLVHNGDGSFTLTAHQSGSKLNFSATGLLASVMDRVGNHLSYSYLNNSFLPLATITDTQGRTTSFTANAAGQVITQVTDPAGRTYAYGYDGNGNLTSSTDAAGKITTYGYDSTHLLTQITDPDGNVTRIAYDGSRRVTSLTDANTHVTSFTYNSGNTVVTDANTHATTYAFDTRGRVTGVTYPDSTTSSTTWTADNHVASETTPKHEITSYSYDGTNNLTQVRLPTGATTTYAYANSSFPYNPSSVTDEEGRTTSFGYTSSGLLNSTTDALNHTGSASYNGNGTVASQTDENGHTTQYSYVTSGNGIGLPSRVDYPALSGQSSPLGSDTFSYDSANRVYQHTDGKGQATTYWYDSLDRTTRLGYAGFAGGPSQVFAYDAEGDLLSMKQGGGGQLYATTTYSYDAAGQPTSKTLPAGPYLADGHSIDSTYDAAGNLLTKTDTGGQLSYAYSPNDELSRVTDPQGAQTTFAYDQDGNQTQMAYPNGVSQTMSYDAAGQLTAMSSAGCRSGACPSFSYGYTNPATNRYTSTRYSMTDGAGNVTAYSYDALSRLTTAVQRTSGGTQLASYGYGYDAVGNMTSKTINGVGTSMQSNVVDQLTAAGNTVYSYDLNGNQLSSTNGNTLAYNSQDQTTSITPSGGSSIPLTYTGPGQAERTGNGSTSYQYDNTGLSTVATSAGTTSITNGPNGELVSERVPGRGTYYYLFDGLGSVVGVTDSSGNLVNTYSYDPYGNTTSVSEQVPNSFRYIGALWDASTGLYKMGERYYDPSIGRFTQLDPLGDGYGYASADPINFIDPTGLGSKKGRKGQQTQKRILAKDKNVARHIRGWLRNEKRSIRKGNSREGRSIRNPPGYELAHKPLTPARKGFNYPNNSAWQVEDIHNIQTKAERNAGYGLIGSEPGVGCAYINECET